MKDKIHDKFYTNYTYDAHNHLQLLDNPYFKEYLHYDVNLPGNSIAKASYNGNISALTIAQNNQFYNMWVKYDAVGRVANTAVSTGATETFKYDVMGNILNLKRKNSKGVITDLSYSYTGNLQNGCGYDENGNENENNSKKIAKIEYNLLNLPNKITFSNGNSLKFCHLADGRRIETTSYTQRTALSSPIDDNCIENLVSASKEQELMHPSVDFTEVREGDLVIVDGVPAKLEFGNGYFDLRSQNLVSATNGAVAMPHYYVFDNLGSVRTTVAYSPGNQSFTPIQHVAYTPTGAVMSNTNEAAQDRLYCGKALQTMHGWDTYDSDSRLLGDGLMRFTTMDPQAGKYYGYSPYVYCGNDPVNRTDPDGESWVSKRVNNTVFFYYDREVSSQADVNREYGEKSGVKYIADGTKYRFGKDIIEFHNDEKNNKDGYAYLNGQLMSKDDFTDKGAFVVFGTSDMALNAKTLYNNMFGSCYIGPTNPKTYGVTTSYAWSPAAGCDSFAYQHDQAYDRAGASGPTSALFNLSVRKADWDFAMQNGKNIFTSPSWTEKGRSFLCFIAFYNIATAKYIVSFPGQCINKLSEWLSPKKKNDKNNKNK